MIDETWTALPPRKKRNTASNEDGKADEKAIDTNESARNKKFQKIMDNIDVRSKAVNMENLLERKDGCAGEFYECELRSEEAVFEFLSVPAPHRAFICIFTATPRAKHTCATQASILLHHTQASILLHLTCLHPPSPNHIGLTNILHSTSNPPTFRPGPHSRRAVPLMGRYDDCSVREHGSVHVQLHDGPREGGGGPRGDGRDEGRR